MAKTITVTGGSGKVGQHLIAHLLSRGHSILNLDLAPLPAPLSDHGQVHNALTSRFHDSSPYHTPLNAVPDALIHLAGYPRNMIVPDVETFRVNTQAGFNVLDAACRLGIKKIIIASTACVYGPPYGEGEVEFASFPVDEETETVPMDTYGISKLCVEHTARGFARRFAQFGVDIYVLRLAAVIAPGEYAMYFDKWRRNPAEIKAVGWSYTDARDFGRMCELAVGTDGLGFQVFNATNDEITAETESTGEFLRRETRGVVRFTREMEGREAPLSNRKIKDVLGFRQEHPWQRYYSYS
ncbi:hypothetical protein BJX61DRAFT_549978 [Aspergillus egyptiacus]|nr:hypothetical protein BJX61DRAFT_549978 [Aspergillus egyptiacus]